MRLKDLKRWGEEINKVLENPIIDHSIDWLGDYVMGNRFWKKRDDGGTTKREINPDWIRAEAPHLFAETHLDENVLREILYSRDDNGNWLLKPAWRVALFDNWGPDATLSPFAEPIYSLGQIGRNQWNDIRLCLVDEVFKRQDGGLVPLEGGARKQKIQDLCATLTEIAKLPNQYKLQRFVRMNYCKAHEGDYAVVRYQRLRNRAFITLHEFFVDLRNWLADNGPTGFRSIATIAAAGVGTGAAFTGAALNNAATTVNNTAERIRPRGFWRLLAGK